MTHHVLINIDVDDLNSAANFYLRAFDLRIARRFGAFGVELVGASSMFYQAMLGGSVSRPRGLNP